MNKEQAEEKVIELVKERKGRVVSKNVVSAALHLFTDPGKSVEKLFYGIKDDMTDEKLKIEQELILDMVCQISEAVVGLEQKFSSTFEKDQSIMIAGLIEVEAKDSENVTGVHIKGNSGQVEFSSGSKISVKSDNSKNTTGLKIGD